MIDIAKKAHNLKIKYTQTRQLTTDTFNELVDLFVQNTLYYESPEGGGNGNTNETAESIRDKLQTLQLDFRLDSSAIKNLPENSIQFQEQIANTVFAAPTIYNGLPTFRVLLHKDLPLLTSFVATSGTISSADSILSAIQKLDGNLLLKAPITNPIFIGVAKADTFEGNLIGNASTATNIAWSGITSTPTTLYDYGITDAEPAFTKNTAFNKNFGTTADTVVEGNDERIEQGQTAFGWGNHTELYQLIGSEKTEQLIGTIDGVNRIFTTSVAFQTGTLIVYLNGLKERFYTIDSDTQITFDTAPKNNGFVDNVEATFTIK